LTKQVSYTCAYNKDAQPTIVRVIPRSLNEVIILDVIS